MQKLPKKLYLAKQVREMDRIAIEDKGILGIDLMDKAGITVFNVVQKYYKARDVIVFCGAGNNAGDGYVVARLALESGLKITVYSVSKPEKLRGDAHTAYKNYIQVGGVVSALDLSPVINNAVIIDALLGTGLNRKITTRYAEAIKIINDSVCPVISVDIPTGLNADTGSLMGCAVKADYTVSFIGLKQGMFTGFSPEYCGKIIFESLNIPNEIVQRMVYSAKRISNTHLPKRNRCAHKGNHGHVLVVGGDHGYSGAARLAAEAALRMGAGLVSVATRDIHCKVINAGRPELMCHAVEQADKLMPLLKKASVVVIGPGLGKNEWGQDMFDQIVGCGKTLVMDADALNLLANKNAFYERWVLTPHPGEAARLLKCSTSDIAKDRFAAVSALKNKFGGVVALKGAGTLICSGDKIFVSNTGNPGMASGGMGDVLSGMVGGLIAQSMSLQSATKSAVFLHGKAADLSAEQEGEIGMLASDLMPFIRNLVNE